MVRAKGRGIGWRTHFLEWTGDENPSQPHEIGESTLDDHKELCQGNPKYAYGVVIARQSDCTAKLLHGKVTHVKVAHGKVTHGKVAYGEVAYGKVVHVEVVKGKVILGKVVYVEVINGKVVYDEVVNGKVVHGKVIYGKVKRSPGYAPRHL
ncbi:hypothetical protein M514_10993 [Trichuris suis]|uniref:Uncharacterized protein n=1 Tax=Trichuris suis TaxID=68888 RepID=A0A085MX56_9BILA|nr:hypothetical protein M514_10993 [Trichuris suis]